MKDEIGKAAVEALTWVRHLSNTPQKFPEFGPLEFAVVAIPWPLLDKFLEGLNEGRGISVDDDIFKRPLFQKAGG